VPAPRAVPSVLAQAAPTGYVPIVPARLVDTRLGQGGGALGPGEARRVVVAGSPLAPSVPPGSTGVLLNVTVTEPTATGYFTV
jgi:hypothetical protein